MFQKIKNIPAETWIWCLFSAVNIILIGTMFAQFMVTTVVRGDSMNPTLKNNTCLIALVPWTVHAGDVVVVDSECIDTTIIKRVIALPGDTVAIANNTVYRNGIPQSEDYIPQVVSMGDMAPITLQENMYFVMGDNRDNSLDSRVIGPVSREEIRYRVPLKAQLMLWLLRLVLAVAIGLPVANLAEWETDCVIRFWEAGRKKSKGECR